ncbi:MAG: ABC transporter permease subunit [Clostridiaceae bacterium]
MIKKYKPYILLLPVTIVLLGIFAFGLVTGLLQSLGYFPEVGLKEITLRYYIEVLKSNNFMSSLKFSIFIAVFSSILATVLGVLLAYCLMTNEKNKRIKEALYKLPIIVPHSVVALLAYNLLSQYGILPRILHFSGLLKDQSLFPSMIGDRNGVGIIVSYLWKEIPFVAMVTYSVFANMNGKLEEVALNLGAKKSQVFWYILLPLSMPTIFSSFLIIFAYSFGAFEVPYLLGPTAPKTLPVMAYVEYINPNLTNRPYSMVYNMIISFVAIVLVFFYGKIFNKINKYNR